MLRFPRPRGKSDNTGVKPRGNLWNRRLKREEKRGGTSKNGFIKIATAPSVWKEKRKGSRPIHPEGEAAAMNAHSSTGMRC